MDLKSVLLGPFLPAFSMLRARAAQSSRKAGQSSTRLAASAFLGLGLAGSACDVQAAVISGPVLNIGGLGYSVTGLEFKALQNSTLTSFYFINQGLPDTVVLTDTAGNILHSVATPAGDTTHLTNVNWALSSGSSYWLLQTTASNELFTYFDQTLPSNSDIGILFSGSFAYSIQGAVNGGGFPNNAYWAAFNNITTSAASVGGVPELSTWAMMLIGLAGLGVAGRRAARKAAAALPT